MKEREIDSGNPATGRPPPWSSVASVAIVAFAALLSIAASIAVDRFEEDKLEARIGQRADDLLSLISARLPAVGRSVTPLAVLFEHSEIITYEEFVGVSSVLLEQYPEIGVFEWVPRVALAQRENFLSRIRAELSEDFEIVDVPIEGDRSPAPARPESWPITYIYPFEGNERIWGFDLVAGPTTALIRTAIGTDMPVMGPARKLVQAPDGDFTLFFIQAVHVSHLSRETSFRGFVQGLAPASRVFAPAVALAEINGLYFEVADITDGEAAPVFSTLENPDLQRDGVLLASRMQEHVFASLGRQLRLRTFPNSAFLESQKTYYSHATLFGGLLATALLGLYLQGLLRRTSTIAKLVDRRTSELMESNRKLIHEAGQRRQAEEAALRAQQSFKFLVDSVDGIVWQVDTERDCFVFVNRRAQDILGYPVEAWLGTPHFWSSHLHPDDRERARRTYYGGVEKGGTFEQTYRMIAADGRSVWLCDYVRIVQQPGKPKFAHSVSFDVTKQRAAEEILERDAHFLSNVDDALIVTDLDGVVTFWNHGAEMIFGWPEMDMIRKHLGHPFSPAVASAITRNLAAVARGMDWSGEWRDRRKDGSRIILESRATRYLNSEGNPVGIFTITRDITERKRQEKEKAVLEAKLQQTQKLESLGVLAGGIAHDFNNLLTGILGHSSLMRMEIAPGGPMDPSLAAIEQSAKRAAELCQQMLAYAGRGRFVVEPIDIGELVRDTSKLLETSVAKNASIEYSLQPGAPLVRADATQIRQVVMNLVINAAESFGDKRGKIRVSTGVTVASRETLDSAMMGLERAPGRYVFLEVADKGSGIKPDHLRKIFEPFFTTKFTGRGLGLAAVLGIVRSHEGALIVESTPGEGTTFRILLPPTLEAGKTNIGPTSVSAGATGGRILIIDDEPFVRDTARLVLQKSGHTIDFAIDGSEGVAKFEANPDGFDVVLLDLTMPGIHGVEVFRRIRAIRPAQSVIVMSGYTVDEATNRFDGDEPDDFLEKPFHASDLISKVAGIVSRIKNSG